MRDRSNTVCATRSRAIGRTTCRSVPAEGSLSTTRWRTHSAAGGPSPASSAFNPDGPSVEDLQRMIDVRPGPNGTELFVDPRLIGADGRANPQVLLSPTTPGEH